MSMEFLEEQVQSYNSQQNGQQFIKFIQDLKNYEKEINVLEKEIKKETKLANKTINKVKNGAYKKSITKNGSFDHIVTICTSYASMVQFLVSI